MMSFGTRQSTLDAKLLPACTNFFSACMSLGACFFWVKPAWQGSICGTQTHGLCSNLGAELLSSDWRIGFFFVVQVFVRGDCKSLTCQVLRNFQFTSNTGQAKASNIFRANSFIFWLRGFTKYAMEN